MDEKNPLQTYTTPSLRNNAEDLNKGGRPVMNSVIKFGPQPRSIIAQMLSELKTKTKSESNFMGGLIIVEEDPTGQNELSQDIIQTKQFEEYVCLTCSSQKFVHFFNLHSLGKIILLLY